MIECFDEEDKYVGIATFELLQQMGENNRNCKKLSQVLGDDLRLNRLYGNNLNIHRQSSQKYPNTKREEALPQQFIQLPVTHLKVQDPPSSRHFTDLSQSESQQQLQQSSASQLHQQYNSISDLFTEYENIIKNIDTKDAETRKKMITELMILCSKCLEIKIEPPLEVIIKSSKKSEEEDSFVWMMLMISGTLNLWKLLSESTQTDKSLPILDVVKKSCKKLVSFLQITKGKKSAFSMIPDKAKNKLILLLIIWAKQELSMGNKQESLKICNLCSNLITTPTDNNRAVQSNNRVISRQNKFKLHYLRMKIFYELGQQKEEVEEIIICETLLKAINEQPVRQKSSKKISFENQIFQKMENPHKIHTQNNSSILNKLEKRKQEILCDKKSIKHSSSHSQISQLQVQKNDRTLMKCNSKFKQIRDSFQITCRDEEEKSSLNKSKLNRARSVSSNKLSKGGYQTNIEGMQMKNTLKQEFQSLHHSKIGCNQNWETANKFVKNGKRLKIESGNTKSLSFCKLGMNSTIQNKKKIQQKYELTSKKLTKRPMLSINKNKEFENVLIVLENELCGQTNIKDAQHFCSLNYYQLLAKRPQNKHIAFGSHLKNAQENAIQLLASQHLNNQKKTNNSQKDQNNLNDKKQRSAAAISTKTLRDCIEKIERQTVQKYFQKIGALRKKRNASYKQNENFSQEKIDNEESLSEESDSDTSEAGLDLKSKDKNKDGGINEARQNKLHPDDLASSGDDEFPLEFNIKRALFPGLGMCDIVKVTIKKVRQIHKSTLQDFHQSVLMMSAQFYCDSGVYWLIHKLPQDLFQPGLSITKNILRKFDADLISLRMKNKTYEGQYSEQEKLNRAILKYIKLNMEIVNKGLGLRFKQKIKKQSRKEFHSVQLDTTISKSFIINRIYLERKSSLHSLFSDTNLFNISLKKIYLPNSKSTSHQYWGKLKILFIAIQKTKKDKSAKCVPSKIQKKNQKVNIVSEQQVFPFNLDFLKQIVQNDHQPQAEKKNPKRQSILKLNPFQPVQIDEKETQKETSLENLLVPVVKYIVLGETSKPKHKLKTMLTKTKENVWDSSIFQNEDECNQHEQKRVKHSNSKYGLLAPYIDDESTVKIRNISTSIYAHIIGKFFMEGSKKNYLGFIPQEFMLSLKYYLMIPEHINRSINIIDQFYEKFEYRFFHKLNCIETSSSNKKTCIVTVNLFRVKKLYRIGLQKFYLIKFSVQEKRARAQLNQLIATSYDINRHFHGPEFDLSQLLEQVQEWQSFCPIQNVPWTELSTKEITSGLGEQNVTNVRIKSIGDKKSNIDEDDNQKKSIYGNDLSLNGFQNKVEGKINSARSEIISDVYHSQSQGQAHSEIQFEQIATKKRKEIYTIIQSSKTNLKRQNCDARGNISQSVNNLHVSWNRVSCPEKKFLNQLSIAQNANKNMFSLFSNSKHRPLPEAIEHDTQRSHYSEMDNFNPNNQNHENMQPNSTNSSQRRLDQIEHNTCHKKITEDSIALCLKKISERITIYKTFLHSKIGIQPVPASTSDSDTDSRQKIACYANRFRFSRNKNLNAAEQFLSPHINCLEILFQKTTKIQCDGVFAVLTVLKIKHCQQFYIKIYVPSCQKTMSFTISCQVFQYFSAESLVEIFTPYVSFNFQQDIQQKGTMEMKQYMVGKITEYFASQISGNEGEDYNQKMKVIWGRIFRHLQFERRYLGTTFQQGQAHEVEESQLYLIAKLGSFQAFVKNFSVDEYIVVKNSKGKQRVETSSIIQVEVSLGQKLDGLNFLEKNKHSQAMKLEKKFRKKKKESLTAPNPEACKRMQSSFRKSKNIYQSQANKHIIYICITNSKTNQKICYSYYLCQILHLIDYSSLGVVDQSDRDQDEVYRMQSEQFKEIILNYAILFKVLNYIKNQFIIQLQSNGRSYLPRLYRDPKLKEELKSSVDKILLFQNPNEKTIKKSKGGRLLRKESIMQSAHNQENIFNNLLNNLLSCTLKLKSGTSSEAPLRLKQSQKKQQVKITFNSEIKCQQSPKISFLVRKVVARKGHPVSCIFLNKIQNRLKIYLSNSKNGRTREIEIPISSHPLPYIDILIKQTQFSRRREESESENQQFGSMEQSKKDGGLMLSLRSRLRKYHHNMTLLASI